MTCRLRGVSARPSVTNWHAKAATRQTRMIAVRPLTTWTAFRMRDPQAMTSANLPISKAPSRMRDGAHFLDLQYSPQLLGICMRADDGQYEPLALEDVFGDALDIFCGDFVDSLERFIKRTDASDVDE